MSMNHGSITAAGIAHVNGPLTMAGPTIDWSKLLNNGEPKFDDPEEQLVYDLIKAGSFLGDQGALARKIVAALRVSQLTEMFDLPRPIGAKP